jgi:hypothetical protein
MTPTLCDAIPSFEAMKRVWNEQKVQMPEYRSRADLVPAYVIAMGNHSIAIFAAAMTDSVVF